MSERKSWDEYFMQVAKQVSTRATCDRLHVGAIIVKNRTILSTGYNGSISGQPHCDDVGHMMEDGHCIRTIHAGVNAITQAARYGTPISGSSIYITSFPCWNCFKVIVNSGIKSIFYGGIYQGTSPIRIATNDRIKNIAAETVIELKYCRLE